MKDKTRIPPRRMITDRHGNTPDPLVYQSLAALRGHHNILKKRGKSADPIQRKLLNRIDFVGRAQEVIDFNPTSGIEINADRLGVSLEDILSETCEVLKHHIEGETLLEKVVYGFFAAFEQRQRQVEGASGEGVNGNQIKIDKAVQSLRSQDLEEIGRRFLDSPTQTRDELVNGIDGISYKTASLWGLMSGSTHYSVLDLHVIRMASKLFMRSDLFVQENQDRRKKPIDYRRVLQPFCIGRYVNHPVGSRFYPEYPVPEAYKIAEGMIDRFFTQYKEIIPNQFFTDEGNYDHAFGTTFLWLMGLKSVEKDRGVDSSMLSSRIREEADNFLQNHQQ